MFIPINQIILLNFVSEQRLQSFEIFFVRFLHLLAHHPDYDDSESEEGLPALAK